MKAYTMLSLVGYHCSGSSRLRLLPLAAWLEWLAVAALVLIPVSVRGTTWVVPDDFSTLQAAVVDDRVQSNDVVLVRWRAEPYVGQVSTTMAKSDFNKKCELNLATTKKRLYFRRYPGDTQAPVLEFARTVDCPADVHVWLKYGGELSGFTLRGPGTLVPGLSGVGFPAESLVAGNTISNYSGTGVQAYCAANAYGIPSGVRNNLIAFNGTGIDNGDVQHIHSGNIVMGNNVGLWLVSGSSAQVFNNLIVSNTVGVRAESHVAAWATYPEILNNTFYSNHVGIEMVWTTNGAPISASIRDNIFAHNSGEAIDANTVYGPMLCTGPGTLATNQGGCYAQIRNNLFFQNNGATDPSDPLYRVSNFWYRIEWDPSSGRTNIVMHVPNPGGDPTEYGNRMVSCLFEDPLFASEPPWSGANPWTLKPTSPCLDRGSRNLRLGYIAVGPSTEPGGNPLTDVGRLDIGYHRPLPVLPR